MTAAYGAIARRICQCMKERKKLLGSCSSGEANNDSKKEEEPAETRNPGANSINMFYERNLI
jgi:hypothetical protein